MEFNGKAHTVREVGNAVLHIERHRDRRILSLGGTLRERFEAEMTTSEFKDNVCAIWMARHESILLSQIG